jgi:hypothetical protein
MDMIETACNLPNAFLSGFDIDTEFDNEHGGGDGGFLSRIFKVLRG